MKNILFIISLFFFYNYSAAQNWTLVPNQSKIEWAGKAAFNAYALGGTLQLQSSNLTVIDSEIESATFVFDMKTIDSEIKDLTKHLKSKDFFEVKKYKTATFKLINLTTDEENQTIANGDLTIKNKTQKVTFPIQLDFINNQLAIKGKAIINRTEYGITFNSPSFFEKMKDQAIADDFELIFTLVFSKD